MFTKLYIASKFKGIRAALCTSGTMAKMTRLHNDSNVLCLGSEFDPAYISGLLRQNGVEIAAISTGQLETAQGADRIPACRGFQPACAGLGAYRF